MNGTRNNTAIISSSSSPGHLLVGFFSAVNPYTADSCCCITQTAHCNTAAYSTYYYYNNSVYITHDVYERARVTTVPPP